ncbi:transglycosylase domain-containing protein [Sphingomonas hengshuiensis]|uniref:peptidoglycan glycosyltransferase n=1 Tax=Sphingomonas hengshuiensis TaxID=1609977 RepID=A0A7U4LG66_9SPHN|nr:transglycosylase domain-containing protein [Sphingomonas hengshuiensis]AJP72988.1 hypothetical protein TS85_16095 [Sphingomonas hengshuiensis]
MPARFAFAPSIPGGSAGAPRPPSGGRLPGNTRRNPAAPTDWASRIFFAAGAFILLTVAAAMAGLFYLGLHPLDPAPVIALERQPTIVFLDADGRKLASELAPGPHVRDLMRRAENGQPNARHVLDAVVAIEDQDFWERDGVALLPLAKAMLLEGRGGSTLTMQLIKNVYWRPDRQLRNTDDGEARVRAERWPDRFIRKFQEIFGAPTIERQLDKPAILGAYLRRAPDYDSQGRGIEPVAQLFYGKYPEELTAAEAATLAATLKGPSGYDPRNVGIPGRQPPRTKGRDGRQIYAPNTPLSSPDGCDSGGRRLLNNRCRALLVLAKMRTRHLPGSQSPMLSEADYAAARQEVLTLGTCDDSPRMAKQRALGLRTPDEQRCRRTPNGFLAIAMEELDGLGIKASEGETLEVATSFERASHTRAVSVIEALKQCAFPPTEMGVADLRFDGGVRSIIELPPQGADFSRDPEATKSYFGIPPGSTLKPFIYAAYLAADPTRTEATPIADDNALPERARDRAQWPVQQNMPWWTNRDAPAATMSLAEAFARSRNRPVLRMAAEMGPEPIRAMMDRAGMRFYGVRDSLEAGPAHGFPTTLAQKWPMALLGEGGAARVRPVELAAAYAAFANAGHVVRAHAIIEVVAIGSDGRRRVLYRRPPPTGAAAIDPGIAQKVDTLLAGVVRSGTAADTAMAALGTRGKTGTISGSRYGWFIGYVPGTDRIVGVWIHSPVVRTRDESSHEGNRQLEVNGADAAKIAYAVLGAATGDTAGGPIPEVCPKASRVLGEGLKRLSARRAEAEGA